MKNNDIKEDLFDEKFNDYLNQFVSFEISNNPKLVNENSIFELEFNIDGTKKDIYQLASERDIKKMQIESDKNELDFKISQNKISKNEYDESIDYINNRLLEQNILYDDMIFDIIDKKPLEEIKEEIKKYNLNNIDLSRLASAIVAVSENKINEFRKNNRNFMIDKLSYWNYKYNKISKGISKAREVESFIISMIGEK